MPTWPIVRLGCVTLDPRQAHTYWAWAARNGLLPALCCQPPTSPGGCWADTPTTPYVDPVTDCADWIDINYSESNEFLGVYLTDVSGLSDTVSSRASSQSTSDGASVSAPVIGGRAVRLRGYLAASSCEGMEWGKQWFRRVLDDVCRWGGSTTAECSTGIVSVRTYCPNQGDPATDGIRDLMNVSLLEGPTFTPTSEIREELQCSCTRLTFDVTLLAGDARLFRPPSSVIARSSFAGALSNATLPALPILPTIPTEPACIAAPSAPPADLALPTYDDYGRPSCGAGSAYYLSGQEEVNYDEHGYPSAGLNSAYYMRLPGETPIIDWMGRPSCGSGSANYRALAATSIITNEQLYTTSTVAGWATKTASIGGLSWAQADAATYRFTGTGRIRNVRIITYALNAFSTTPQKIVADKFLGGLQTLPLTTSSALPGSSDQYAWQYRVDLTWEERIDAGQSTTLDWSVAAFSSSGGPNGGVDRACEGHYAGPNGGVDRARKLQCVSRAVLLPSEVFPTLSPGDVNHPMGGSNANRAIPLLDDEGDRIPGTLSIPGSAFYTVRFPSSGIDAVNVAGVTILWVRLRARFATPKGTDGKPYPWTISAGSTVYPWNLSGGAIGGRSGSLEAYDGTEDILFPLPYIIQDIDVSLAAPIGGTEGWLDYLALEIEYVGGPTNLNCGPNAGRDVPCASTATTGCYVAPSTVALASGRVVGPVVAPLAPVITIEAGAVDLSNVALYAWQDPMNRSAPTVDQASFDFWRALNPCMVGEIAWLPAFSTLVIDCRAKTVTLQVNGFAVEASRYLTGKKGDVWLWPKLLGPIRVAAVAPSTVDASAKVTVTAAIAEGV